MNELVKLLRESVLLQAIITLLAVSTMLYLYIVGRDVPPELLNIVLLIVGYYFGSKTQNALNRMRG